MNTNKRINSLGLRSRLSRFPGYALLIIWLIFTVCLVGWIILASFSTTKEILTNKLLSSGLHFENYKNAISKQPVSVYFLNSLFYSSTVCLLVIIIAAPASYVLSRYKFRSSKLFTTLFTSAMGIPIIMIILPIYAMMNRL